MSFSLDLGQRSRNQNMRARHALQEIEILFIKVWEHNLCVRFGQGGSGTLIPCAHAYKA